MKHESETETQEASEIAAFIYNADLRCIHNNRGYLEMVWGSKGHTCLDNTEWQKRAPESVMQEKENLFSIRADTFWVLVTKTLL